MKKCIRCNEEKYLSEFHNHKGRKDGKVSACKVCANARAAAWSLANPNHKRKRNKTEAQKQAARDRARQWRLDNPERFQKNKAEWAAKNAAKIHQYKVDWQKRNRHKVHAQTMKRRAKKLSATPSWANNQAIQEIYGIARDLCVLTGQKWEVDHIIPLRGKLVSGLHVEGNLQIIPASINRSKQNRYEIA